MCLLEMIGQKDENSENTENFYLSQVVFLVAYPDFLSFFFFFNLCKMGTITGIATALF